MKELICQKTTVATKDLVCSKTGDTIKKGEKLIQQIFYTGTDLEYIYIKIRDKK